MTQRFRTIQTLLAGAMILCGAAASCASPPFPRLGPDPTENGRYGFTFAAPRGWTALPPPMGDDSILHLFQNREPDSHPGAVFYQRARLEVIVLEKGRGEYTARVLSRCGGKAAPSASGDFSFTFPCTVLKGGSPIEVPHRVRARLFACGGVDLAFQIVCLDAAYEKKYASLCDRLFGSVSFFREAAPSPGPPCGSGDLDEARIQRQIARLPPGWRVHRTVDGRFVLCSNAAASCTGEAVRMAEELGSILRDLFPRPLRIRRTPLIRIFGSREEYLGYGGRPGTSGYWSGRHGEIVVYHDRSVEREESLRVLRHELCHRFLHDLLGASPPPWLDEGAAEFFSACRFENGSVIPARRKGKRNILRSFLGKGACPPVRELIHLTRDGFMAAPRLNYARAWSFFDFLFASRDQAALDENWWRRGAATWIDRVAATGDRKAADQALHAGFPPIEWEKLEEAWAASLR